MQVVVILDVSAIALCYFLHEFFEHLLIHIQRLEQIKRIHTMSRQESQSILPADHITERKNIELQIVSQLQFSAVAELFLQQNGTFSRYWFLRFWLPLAVIFDDLSRVHASFMVWFVHIGFEHLVLHHWGKILKVSHLDVVGHAALLSDFSLVFKR